MDDNLHVTLFDHSICVPGFVLAPAHSDSCPLLLFLRLCDDFSNDAVVVPPHVLWQR